MTDGQTDGRTELRWLRRAIAVPAVARKKIKMCYGRDKTDIEKLERKEIAMTEN